MGEGLTIALLGMEHVDSMGDGRCTVQTVMGSVYDLFIGQEQANRVVGGMETADGI